MVDSLRGDLLSATKEKDYIKIQNDKLVKQQKRFVLYCVSAAATPTVIPRPRSEMDISHSKLPYVSAPDIESQKLRAKISQLRNLN